MKKNLSILLVLLMIFALSCAEAEPMLYKVTNGNGTLYLLPTIHFGDEEMAQALSSRILPIVKSADRLAVEIDDATLNNPVNSLRYTLLLRYAGKDTIRAHLPEKTYEAAKALLKRAGQSTLLLDGFKAPVWESLCEGAVCTLAGLQAELGVDQVVMRFARENGVAIEGMETLEEQYQALFSASDALADWFIRELTDDPNAAIELYASLPALFIAGDAQAIWRAVGVDLTNVPEPLANEAALYFDRLLTQRDDNFEQRALQFLSQDEVTVIMIGAAHIIGENGLVKRLTAAGYEVELLK